MTENVLKLRDKKKIIFKKLKDKIFSNIKKRSNLNNIRNEISEDLEKIELKPEDLLNIEYIDKKINSSNNLLIVGGED